MVFLQQKRNGAVERVLNVVVVLLSALRDDRQADLAVSDIDDALMKN